jgi:hypothetical protein
MNNIKIVPNLQPWEVMKRASEGESVALCISPPHADVKWESVEDVSWNWGEFIYAIIDTTAPEIDWSGFDFDFFNQYGGLGTSSVADSSRKYVTKSEPLSPEVIKIRESPFYYWPGGDKAPVPDNVEVEVIMRSGTDGTVGEAHYFKWGNHTSIIAFRITGNVS